MMIKEEIIHILEISLSYIFYGECFEKYPWFRVKKLCWSLISALCYCKQAQKKSYSFIEMIPANFVLSKFKLSLMFLIFDEISALTFTQLTFVELSSSAPCFPFLSFQNPQSNQESKTNAYLIITKHLYLFDNNKTLIIIFSSKS